MNSNKGKPLLVADDYTFKLNKATTSTKYWICTINGYAADVHTDLTNLLMKTVGYHSHLREKEKLELINWNDYIPSYSIFLIGAAKIDQQKRQLDELKDGSEGMRGWLKRQHQSNMI
ncbi:unnamed protein product [Rotaria magnacalcarata]